MATKTSPEIDRQAVKTWLSVVRAYHLCDAVMSERLAKLGVRTAEHEVLANLVRQPGISQQALAARCFTAKSHISALLRSLEQAGLVCRETDPTDARAKRLFVTRRGEALARKTMAAQADIVDAMARSVPAAELSFVQNAMESVSQRLEALLAGDEAPATRASAPRSRRPPPARRAR